ncbi:Uncharacterized protein OS=Isosphaera pallida (strain ATCC 43644 / DSM 9630 / IS1B) GN=Isop_2434 PE=4 SV=1 [Gemmata massiliana]|uniref:Uncharacterized protein n=1 Tax=Gemmata massiliana TaxID=1210884 RepID=A0A6P2D025_9BACT|nr:hypothetical protein [Gemmata massiliana]VTR92810.1 Uncharacterized protein OS=Isosphaera pallida (strain ATCC 43644 / DSM 9630 / IS1B) GN=Isop_2434 PE=4 SV=1 [Gemmata massiliana]
MPNRQQRRKAASVARRETRQVKAAVTAARAVAGSIPKTVPPQRISGRAAPVAITGAEAPTADQPARFEMVAYTGEAMRIGCYGEPVIVDLETADLSEPLIPALYDHWAHLSDIVGQVETLAIENKQLVARGRFTPIEPDATGRGGNRAGEVLKLARQGYRWQASVGADPAQVIQIEAGAVGVANWGREYPGPCVIGRGCKFREMSFVVLGGDRKTSVLAARHRSTPIQGAAMNPTFDEWLAAMGFADPAALDPTQSANLKLLYQSEYPEGETEEEEPATEPPPVEPVTAAAQRPAIRATGRGGRANTIANANRIHAANLERIDRINAIHAEHGCPQIDAGGGRMVSLAAHAIRSNWDVSRTELAAIRASRPNPEPNRTRDTDANRLQAATVEAAILITAGFSADRVGLWVASSDRERVMNEAVGSRFRGYSLHAVMDETIRAAGHHFHGSRKSDDFIRAALDADRMIRASQGFTTVSLSNVLGNTANKAMNAAYEAQAVAWKLIAAVRSHSDFKAVTRVRLDSTGAFKKVGQDGELKHVGLSEGAYTNQLATFGAIIALTRQMMINDDLQAFLEIPRLLGRMSALRIEELVFVTLLSNPGSFFSGGNGNLLTGAGSAFGVAALTASEAAFDNQVDSNGKPILTVPDRVLVPTTLKTPAAIMYKDTTLVTTTDTQLYSADNPHAGKYQPVVSPYLNNTAIKDQDGAAITGQSSTAWYQFANPAVRAAIAVAFLNGQETPTIQDAETDFSTLGRQWRAFHDFGVGMEDTTAVVKNAGA